MVVTCCYSQFMDKEWLETQFKLNPDKNKADLARALGLEPPAVSKMLHGKRQIKAGEYVAMRRFFGLPSDGARGAGLAAATSYVLETLAPEMRESGPEDAAADDAWVMPAHIFQNRTKAPPEKIKIFTVHGDAMLPDFKPGAQVLVDLSDIKPSPAGEFVVSDGHGHIIRQCEFVPHSNPPEIKLSALNKKYEPYTVLLEKAEIIGRVLAKLEWRGA